MQFFCMSHKGFRNLNNLFKCTRNICLERIILKSDVPSVFESINMKRLDIILRKERQCHITKQLVLSFSVNIRWIDKS